MMVFRRFLVEVAVLFVVLAFFKATGEACEDGYPSQCPGWKQYCGGSAYGAFMEMNCKKTCGLCGISVEWSTCTKTCGAGTRFRPKVCPSGECPKVFEACNTQDCPPITCDYRYTRPRYGMSHACCNPRALPSDYTCGKPKTNTRVRGGESSKAKQWPWMALIKWNNGLCGGVLINSNFVVAAAHCFTDDYGYKLSTTGWKIYFGVLRLNQLTAGVNRDIKKVTLHPSYSFPANDIAVVELKASVPTTSTTQPICLPGGEITPQDTTCYITGWGLSQHSTSATAHLQEGAIQNLDLQICKNEFAKEPDLQHTLTFLNGNTGYLCAGSLHTAVDSCEGDSGGPLVCQRCSTCNWYLAGITSLGHPKCGTLGIPAIYTRVRDYETWIVGIAGMTKGSVTCN